MTTLRNIVLMIGMVLLSAPSFAQEGPSYEETLKFIRSKIDLNYQTSTNRLLESKRCHLTQQITIQSTYKGRRKDDVVNYSFALSDLDPSRIFYEKSSIYPNEGSVMINTRENRDRVYVEQIFFREKRPGKSFVCKNNGECRTTFAWPDHLIKTLPPYHDNGPRVARALIHLVKLCGGKEELF